MPVPGRNASHLTEIPPMPPTHRPHRTRRSSSEHGFTLVEMLVAMVILAILGAAAVLAFKGTKETTYHKQAITVANAYSQAIASYQADHANRNPVIADPKKGPINLIGKPYLGTIPDGVSNGQVRVRAETATTAGCPRTPLTGHPNQSQITICTDPNTTEYAIYVITRPGAGAAWNAQTACWIGPNAQMPRCDGP